jgi:hypothetical protein
MDLQLFSFVLHALVVVLLAAMWVYFWRRVGDVHTLRGFEHRLMLAELTTADTLDRLKRFQNREGMRAARESKTTQADRDAALNDEALRLIAAGAAAAGAPGVQAAPPHSLIARKGHLYKLLSKQTGGN